jgi:hypothetical protein
MVFEDFQQTLSSFRKLCWSWGLDVFDENYKFEVNTFVTCTLAVLANILPVYSIIVKYPDFMAMLKTTALWGVSLQVLDFYLNLDFL